MEHSLAGPRLTRTKGRWGLAWTANVVLGLLVVTVGCLTLHAAAITRAEGSAPTYMLYDDHSGWLPRELMVLGFYRITRASHERFGPDSVVVAPLTDANLRTALKHGRFVFLACHGSRNKGDIAARNLAVIPMKFEETRGEVVCRLYTVCRQPGEEDFSMRRVVPGCDLQFVYNTACDGGVTDTLWQEALASAEVRTFPNTSAVAEHILWLWFAGPERVAAIKSR